MPEQTATEPASKTSNNTPSETLAENSAIDESKDLGLWKGVRVADMLAFPSGLAARLLGMNRTTLYHEMSAGKITKTRLGIISRAEMERYLKSETEKCRKR